MSGAAKWFLTLRAAGTIFLFYAFAAASILFLTTCVLAEFTGGFVGGRFPWAIRVRRVLKNHFRLLKTFARSLRLAKTASARIPLSREEAPEIFSMIETMCAQTQIAPPQQVLLEMQMNAWVRLDGFRRASGRVVLGLGYDLLAGLTRGELEAVLAHELTHAKVTQRVVGHWLAGGLERAVQLSRGLTVSVGARPRQAPSPFLARHLLMMANGLAEAAAQWIAAASRQEEFEADRGAAEMCGPETLGDTLIKIESLSRLATKLSVRERIAQLQAYAFSPWLVRELAAVKILDPREIAAEVPNRFSTHPSLRDRLNALPTASAGFYEPDSRPAIEMLNLPDAIAERLMAKIQQMTIEQEDRDSRDLREWAKKMRTATEMRPLQIFGAVVVIAAEVAGVVAWIFGATLDVATIIFIGAVLGMMIYWLGGYREGFVLPTPDFGLLKVTWPSEPIAKIKAVQELESASDRIKEWTAGKLAAKSIDALRECDYARAEVAANLCLKKEPKSVPALLVSAVAGAWLGKGREVTSALAGVQRAVGMRGGSICWGAAWTYMLRGNWARAEALLQQTLATRPADPTLLNLRALCQMRRGKIQSAIISARRACHPHPANREHAKFLVDLLLEGGYLREAQQQLAPLHDYIAQDSELMLTAVRLNLLLHSVDVADHWAAILLNTAPPPYIIVRLGAAYELARESERSSRFYREALARAYFPDACLGLARLAAEENNIIAARRHTLDALSLLRTPGRFATPPLELLRPTLLQLAALEPPSRFCRAWSASLSSDFTPTALGGRSFVIYAEAQPQAERYLRRVIEAMAGAGQKLAPGNIVWKQAAPEHQPVGLVRPGVQPLSDENGHATFHGFQRQGLWQSHHAAVATPVDTTVPLEQCA